MLTIVSTAEAKLCCMEVPLSALSPQWHNNTLPAGLACICQKSADSGQLYEHKV